MTKTALITGASQGLGLALAQSLAQDGWQLLITARGAERLERARIGLARWTNVVAVAGDVGDKAHRLLLAEKAEGLGGLNLVVNNAGILGPSPQPHLLDYPLTTLANVFHLNTLAPLGILQAVENHLKPNPTIINVSSDAGVEGYAGWGGYGSSKAALEQLSRVLAAENPKWRVYWVDPGDMRTAMHQAAFPGQDISDRPLPEASIPGFRVLIDGNYPSGRYQANKLTPMEVI